MTPESAADLLGIAPGANPADIDRAYEELYNDFQLRIQNAPTPKLRERFEERLAEIEAAYDVLRGGDGDADLPASSPVEEAPARERPRTMDAFGPTSPQEPAVELPPPATKDPDVSGEKPSPAQNNPEQSNPEQTPLTESISRDEKRHRQRFTTVNTVLALLFGFIPSIPVLLMSEQDDSLVGFALFSALLIALGTAVAVASRRAYPVLQASRSFGKRVMLFAGTGASIGVGMALLSFLLVLPFQPDIDSLTNAGSAFFILLIAWLVCSLIGAAVFAFIDLIMLGTYLGFNRD